MHVAFWSPAWPLQKFQNGIITYVHWMKLALESHGHRVSVFTAELDSSVNDSEVHLVRRGSGGRFRQFINKQFRSRPSYRDVFDFGAEIASAINTVHRDDPIDIIEMEESFGWFGDVKRLTSLPLVVKLHGPAFLSMVDDELMSPLGRERIEREGQALSRVDSIVAPSELTLRQTIEKYELKPKDATRIVNPIVMEEDTPLWRLSACDRNCILFVGRFDLRKGGDVVLNAFASAVHEHDKLRLVFVGPDNGLVGDDGKKVHFNEFRDSVLPSDVRAQVDFRGRMANSEIMALRTQSMLTIVASRWENQGYALLEAMFQGCPVVSTDSGGCPESVVDGVTGLLARSGDPESFSRQISAIVNDTARAELLGSAARRQVMEEHAANKVLGLTLDVYARVIDAH